MCFLAAELFQDKEAHMPLLVVLSSYTSSKGVQQVIRTVIRDLNLFSGKDGGPFFERMCLSCLQVGWSLLCRLVEICPSTLEKLAQPLALSKEWEVLGVHQ